MNYELKKTETNKKSAKFLYEVIDENGNIISSRNSNRDYVACTIYGYFFFGRLDLIGKGDHGRFLKDWATYKPEELYKIQNIAYLKN